jgi:hypothetical protein
VRNRCMETCLNALTEWLDVQPASGAVVVHSGQVACSGHCLRFLTANPGFSLFFPGGDALGVCPPHHQT